MRRLSIRTLFGALIGAQALHSLEEYAFELWSVFPPARFVSGLVSPDLERGFVIVNLTLVTVGVLCYWWPVRRGWPSAPVIAWGWVGIEFVNGVGHPAWSIAQGRYTPGAATALLLLPLSILLARALARPASSRPR